MPLAHNIFFDFGGGDYWEFCLGIFELPKEKVMVLPNLHQLVLGMNTIKMFHIEQSKGNMKITYKE